MMADQGRRLVKEKHGILLNMLDGVYIDLVSKKVVGILPKPPFYRLFESLKRNPEAKALILNPDSLVSMESKASDEYKQEHAQEEKTSGVDLVMVETGEG